MAKQNMKQDYTRYVRTGAPDECWVWFGARQRFGHGMFKVNGKLMLAHRLAYELKDRKSVV